MNAYCFTNGENSYIYLSPLDEEKMWERFADDCDESVEEAKSRYRMQKKAVSPDKTVRIISQYCTDGVATLNG